MEKWYEHWHENLKNLSKETGIPVEKCAGVMAALSPVVPLRQNWKDTVNVVSSFAGGEKIPGVATLPAQREKAIKILSSTGEEKEIYAILAGLKTTAFFLNLLRPNEETEVCIDLWMLRHFGWKNLTPKRKRLAFDILKAEGQKTGLLPHEMQAKIWCEVRNNHE